MMSPERVPSRSSISCPHPLQWTLTIMPPRPCGPGPLAEPKQSFELAAIKTDDDLPVDDRHGCRPVAQLQKLLQSCAVLLDILIDKGNAILRKKLFLLVACPSARLTIDDDVLCHQRSPSCV